jgi:hypothetical protein
MSQLHNTKELEESSEQLREKLGDAQRESHKEIAKQKAKVTTSK